MVGHARVKKPVRGQTARINNDVESYELPGARLRKRAERRTFHVGARRKNARDRIVRADESHARQLRQHGYAYVPLQSRYLHEFFGAGFGQQAPAPHGLSGHRCLPSTSRHNASRVLCVRTENAETTRDPRSSSHCLRSEPVGSRRQFGSRRRRTASSGRAAKSPAAAKAPAAGDQITHPRCTCAAPAIVPAPAAFNASESGTSVPVIKALTRVIAAHIFAVVTAARTPRRRRVSEGMRRRRRPSVLRAKRPAPAVNPRRSCSCRERAERLRRRTVIASVTHITTVLPLFSKTHFASRRSAITSSARPSR